MTLPVRGGLAAWQARRATGSDLAGRTTERDSQGMPFVRESFDASVHPHRWHKSWCVAANARWNSGTDSRPKLRFLSGTPRILVGRERAGRYRQVFVNRPACARELSKGGGDVCSRSSFLSKLPERCNCAVDLVELARLSKFQHFTPAEASEISKQVKVTCSFRVNLGICDVFLRVPFHDNLDHAVRLIKYIIVRKQR